MRICESESAKTAMAAVTDAATQGETKDISGSKLNGLQPITLLFTRVPLPRHGLCHISRMSVLFTGRESVLFIGARLSNLYTVTRTQLSNLCTVPTICTVTLCHTYTGRNGSQ